MFSKVNRDRRFTLAALVTVWALIIVMAVGKASGAASEPDSFEVVGYQDDTTATLNLVSEASVAQVHTFHTSDDEDWLRVISTGYAANGDEVFVPFSLLVSNATLPDAAGITMRLFNVDQNGAPTYPAFREREYPFDSGLNWNAKGYTEHLIQLVPKNYSAEEFIYTIDVVRNTGANNGVVGELTTSGPQLSVGADLASRLTVQSIRIERAIPAEYLPQPGEYQQIDLIPILSTTNTCTNCGQITPGISPAPWQRCLIYHDDDPSVNPANLGDLQGIYYNVYYDDGSGEKLMQGSPVVVIYDSFFPPTTGLRDCEGQETPIPTPSPTPSPTASPSPTPSPSPSPTPSPSPSPTPGISSNWELF